MNESKSWDKDERAGEAVWMGENMMTQSRTITFNTELISELKCPICLDIMHCVVVTWVKFQTFKENSLNDTHFSLFS